jgi:hypothetical protein
MSARQSSPREGKRDSGIDDGAAPTCWNCGADLEDTPPRQIDGSDYCRVCETFDPEGVA